MTAKDKALELCRNFSLTTLFDEKCNECNSLSFNISIKCALICVDEILTAKFGLGGLELDFWKDVKKELLIFNKTKIQ